MYEEVNPSFQKRLSIISSVSKSHVQEEVIITTMCSKHVPIDFFPLPKILNPKLEKKPKSYQLTFSTNLNPESEKNKKIKLKSSPLVGYGLGFWKSRERLWILRMGWLLWLWSGYGSQQWIGTSRLQVRQDGY